MLMQIVKRFSLPTMFMAVVELAAAFGAADNRDWEEGVKLAWQPQSGVTLETPVAIVHLDDSGTSRGPILRFLGANLQQQLFNPAVEQVDLRNLVLRYQVAGPEDNSIGVLRRIAVVCRAGEAELVEEFTLTPARAINTDLEIERPFSIGGACETCRATLPLRNGVAASLPLGKDPLRGQWAMCNIIRDVPAQELGLPMVQMERPGIWQAAVCADTSFSSLYELSARDGSAIGFVRYRYKASKVPIEAGRAEIRRFGVWLAAAKPQSSFGRSLDSFFRLMLPDVPAGPKWLHEIAMVDYDYLSDTGKGWFADIDALAKALPPQDRAKVFLCMHAWYDWVGRYCFDAKTGKFDQQWTTFGGYEKCKNRPMDLTIGGEKVDGGFEKCFPVQLSIAKLHERLAYAKSRGFRVGMYFADGLNSGTGLPNFNKRNVLRMGGWPGPDVPGDTYCLNPLVPEVREFFLSYTNAVLAEFGPEVDAFVWDETEHIAVDCLGSTQVPGYAGLAMMRLVREVAAKMEDYGGKHNREIALLVADNHGYALMAHGTYQDTWCRPEMWSTGIFPNYRNIMWACCWWPIHKQKWIEFGVRNYQAPVPISNGWGDHTGFSEYSPKMRQKVLELFEWRKQKPTQLKPFEKLPTYAN